MKTLDKILSILGILVTLCKFSDAQPLQTRTQAALLTIDFAKDDFTGSIPYDQNFQFIAAIPDSGPLSSIAKVEFGLTDGRGKSGAYIKIDEQSVVKHLVYLYYNFTKFNNGYLKPEHDYTITIIGYDKDDNIIKTITKKFTTFTTVGDHAKLDFGVGYVPKIKGLVAFTTVHLYSTSINDATDLAEIKSLDRNIRLRTSFFIGISPLTILSDTKSPIKNMFALGNLVFGLGIRSPFYGNYMPDWLRKDIFRQILQPLRLDFGEIVFKQSNANPLIVKDKVKIEPYFGLSLDFTISTILGPISKLF